MNNPTFKKRALAVAISSTVALGGCVGTPLDRSSLFGSQRLETGTGRAESTEQAAVDRGQTSIEIEPGPVMATGAPRSVSSSSEVPELKGPPIELSVNELPLPVFINEIFGEKLNLSYTLAPALRNRTDLVTLRLTDPLPPKELFRTARTVLSNYGVTLEQVANIWQFNMSGSVSGDQRPLLITGEAMPEVPSSHRPVFQVVELNVVRTSQITSIVDGLIKGQRVTMTQDNTRNAILLRGPAAEVADAVDAIRYFDQPLLKGKNSILIRPAFIEIPALEKGLTDLLSASGYAVSRPSGLPGTITLVPMPELEALVVLANDKVALNNVQSWATRLDRDYQRQIDSGIFTYEVQNTSAEDLASLVSRLYSGNGTSMRSQGSEDQSTDAVNSQVGDGSLVVDEQRNVLIYRGRGSEWMELLEIIQKLDKTVPSVLLEVLLAEVTLNDSEGTGVEWLAKGTADDLSGTLGTLGGLGLGGRGFTYTLNSAGQTRAVINAFYDSNRAVIRSSPKLMVKSGEEATIEVGNEIPVLTSTTQGDFQSDGNTNVLQQFQYRRTGVTLSVKPIVQASGLVEIEIQQTLAETQDTGSGDTFLPTVFNRSVNTSLTLRDGGSIVLGGLISNTQSKGEQGIPLLGRIPLLGKAFKSESATGSSTELLVMVAAYVLKDESDAQRISDQLREALIQPE